LVCDHAKTEQTLHDIENKKTYVTLLQNQLLGIDNQQLLNEIYNHDQNHFNNNLYSQMQINNDIAPVNINPEDKD